MFKNFFNKNHVKKLESALSPSILDNIELYAKKIVNMTYDITKKIQDVAEKQSDSDISVNLMCECATLYLTVVARFTFNRYGTEKGIFIMDNLWGSTLHNILSFTYGFTNRRDEWVSNLFNDYKYTYADYINCYFNAEAHDLEEICMKWSDRIMKYMGLGWESFVDIYKCMADHLLDLQLREFLDSIESGIINFSTTDQITNSNEEIVFPDGSRYIGESRNGMLHGHGVLSYTDGSQYIGEWMNGLLQGHGTLIYPDRSIYEGEWHDGKMNGFGYLTYPDGRIITGQWENGSIVGRFTIKYGDGTSYWAEILDGEIKLVK